MLNEVREIREAVEGWTANNGGLIRGGLTQRDVLWLADHVEAMIREGQPELIDAFLWDAWQLRSFSYEEEVLCGIAAQFHMMRT